MSPQDEELEQALFGDGETVGDAEQLPSVTVDGYLYAHLLLSFSDLFQLDWVVTEPSKAFLAPAHNSTSRYQ